MIYCRKQTSLKKGVEVSPVFYPRNVQFLKDSQCDRYVGCVLWKCGRLSSMNKQTRMEEMPQPAQ